MTDDQPLVLVDRRSDGVVLITLNRPPMNPLSLALLGAIANEANELVTDDDVKAVVITGTDKAFAAGADVKEFEPNARSARRVANAFRDVGDALATIPRPVIAAIRGYALGGGIELAMACDYRIAADSARVGQPEILLGIIPGGGGTQRLARLVGPARAKELIWSGRQVRADEALAIGLVDEVVPADEVLDRALAMASHLASGAVAAMGLAKRAIDDGFDRPLSQALDLEAAAFAESFDTEDAAIGIGSFNEHGPGKAEFVGR
jgi:enoyl-CoA hydratase/carnithine racemase